MNKIVIGTREHADVDQNTLALTYEHANKWLTMLRSDYFKEIVLADIQQIEVKNLRFLIQFSRLLKNDGSVVLRNGENKELNALLLRLNLHEGDSNQEGKVFLKTKPQPKAEEKIVKLSIGFKSNEAQEEIDQSELMKGENLEITKKKAEKCETKPRACANCSCGRKDAEKNVSKEDLIKGINEGQPVSGCGKCFMGDSFRCGSCPYKGLPAFKPGDKLKLMEEGGVMVEEAATVVSATGKVKLQL